MKKILLHFLLFACAFSYAQTGINTKTVAPHASAALQVNSLNNNTGVLLPRMTTAEKGAIKTPAVGLLVYDTDKKCISQNAGTEAAPNWVCLADKDAQSSFFYMPSIKFDTSTVATGLTKDLYAEYKGQFTKPTKGSTDAPAVIPNFPNATDLYYYVTAVDDTVISITSLDNNGKLTYSVTKAGDFGSFMNVVFVTK